MFRRFVNHIHKYRNGYLLVFVSVPILIYSIVLHRHQVVWDSIQSVKVFVNDLSLFIPVAAAIGAMVIGVFDIMKLFSDIYQERREKKLQKAVNRTKTKIFKLLEEKGVDVTIIEQVKEEYENGIETSEYDETEH